MVDFCAVDAACNQLGSARVGVGGDVGITEAACVGTDCGVEIGAKLVGDLQLFLGGEFFDDVKQDLARCGGIGTHVCIGIRFTGCVMVDHKRDLTVVKLKQTAKLRNRRAVNADDTLDLKILGHRFGQNALLFTVHQKAETCRYLAGADAPCARAKAFEDALERKRRANRIRVGISVKENEGILCKLQALAKLFKGQLYGISHCFLRRPFPRGTLR